MIGKDPYWIQPGHMRHARSDLHIEGVAWPGDDATELCWRQCWRVGAGRRVISPPRHDGDDATESRWRWCRWVGASRHSLGYRRWSLGCCRRPSRCHRRLPTYRHRLSGCHRRLPRCHRRPSGCRSRPLGCRCRPSRCRWSCSVEIEKGSRYDMCWWWRSSISTYGSSRRPHDGHQLLWFMTMI
jgi:hypothetical protein